MPLRVTSVVLTTLVAAGLVADAGPASGARPAAATGPAAAAGIVAGAGRVAGTDREIAAGVLSSADTFAIDDGGINISVTEKVLYACTGRSVSGEVDSEIEVTIQVPLISKHGRDVTVNTEVSPVQASPVDVPPNGLRAQLRVALGHSGSGEVVTSGLTNEAAVPAGQRVPLTGGAGVLPTPAVGVYTYTPAGIELTDWLGQTETCTPKNATTFVATVVEE